MKISISGYSLLGLGVDFKDYVEQRMHLDVERRVSDPSHAKVVLLKYNHLFSVAIIIGEGVGRDFLEFRGDSNASDIYHAFDLALSHLSEQISEDKERISERKA